MYCGKCGKEIDDEAIVCVHCGCATSNHQINSQTNKSMLCAVVLWFLLGGIGAHRFYLGHNVSGLLMLMCLLFCWLIIPGIVLLVWWLIDIIMLVSGGLQPKDGGKLI